VTGETLGKLQTTRKLFTLAMWFCIGLKMVFDGPWTTFSMVLGLVVLVILVLEKWTQTWWLLSVLIPFGMNELAVAANGGKMPVTPVPWLPLDHSHCALTTSTRFQVLCDIHPIFGHVGMYSLGDAVLVIGVPLFGLFVVLCRKALRTPNFGKGRVFGWKT